MKKPHKKLIASAFLTVTAITLMVTVSYAWVTLSGSPSLAGVQINIGGRNTIKIAPDLVEAVVDSSGNTVTVHYPGYFNDTFSVSDYDTYEYLETFSGLKPVSTADGIHWFMPSADADMEVKGSYSLNDYVMEQDLSHANVSVTTGESVVDGKTGSYAYLDFWVAAPMDCKVRVSMGSADEGSYLIGLPEVIADKSTITGYALSREGSDVAACARVGFLVNDDVIAENEPMETYADSKTYYSDYKSLKGYYQEPGSVVDSSRVYRFTIYEPNGTMHTDNGVSYIQSNKGLTYVACENGDYAVTQPIGYENQTAVLADVSEILAVQKTNAWKTTETGETVLSQLFQTTMIEKDLSSMTTEEITEEFYLREMKGQLANYVSRAKFFENTEFLYLFGDGTITDGIGQTYVDEGNATDNAVIVSLERDVPQRIRMYVWLEGQDVDCVREAALEYFAVGIELAGSTND